MTVSTDNIERTQVLDPSALELEAIKDAFDAVVDVQTPFTDDVAFVSESGWTVIKVFPQKPTEKPVYIALEGYMNSNGNLLDGKPLAAGKFGSVNPVLLLDENGLPLIQRNSQYVLKLMKGSDSVPNQQDAVQKESEYFEDYYGKKSSMVIRPGRWLLQRYLPGVMLAGASYEQDKNTLDIDSLTFVERIRLIKELELAFNIMHRDYQVITPGMPSQVVRMSHGDIKGNNVLVNVKLDKNGQKVFDVYPVDFGFTRFISSDNKSFTNIGHEMDTPLYAADEVRAGLKRHKNSDTYSLTAAWCRILGSHRPARDKIKKHGAGLVTAREIGKVPYNIDIISYDYITYDLPTYIDEPIINAIRKILIEKQAVDPQLRTGDDRSLRFIIDLDNYCAANEAMSDPAENKDVLMQTIKEYRNRVIQAGHPDEINVLLTILSDKNYWKSKTLSGRMPHGVMAMQKALKSNPAGDTLDVLHDIALARLNNTNRVSKFFGVGKRDEITSKFYTLLADSYNGIDMKLLKEIKDDWQSFNKNAPTPKMKR